MTKALTKMADDELEAEQQRRMRARDEAYEKHRDALMEVQQEMDVRSVRARLGGALAGLSAKQRERVLQEVDTDG